MIKNKSEIQNRGIEIDLTGPEGNAVFLIGKARRIANHLGGMDTEKIVEEMTSGDYDNLVDVFEKYFGEYVTLYR